MQEFVGRKITEINYSGDECSVYVEGEGWFSLQAKQDPDDRDKCLLEWEYGGELKFTPETIAGKLDLIAQRIESLEVKVSELSSRKPESGSLDEIKSLLDAVKAKLDKVV